MFFFFLKSDSASIYVVQGLQSYRTGNQGSLTPSTTQKNSFNSTAGKDIRNVFSYIIYQHLGKQQKGKRQKRKEGKLILSSVSEKVQD